MIRRRRRRRWTFLNRRSRRSSVVWRSSGAAERFATSTSASSTTSELCRFWQPTIRSVWALEEQKTRLAVSSCQADLQLVWISVFLLIGLLILDGNTGPGHSLLHFQYYEKILLATTTCLSSWISAANLRCGARLFAKLLIYKPKRLVDIHSH